MHTVKYKAQLTCCARFTLGEGALGVFKRKTREIQICYILTVCSLPPTPNKKYFVRSTHTDKTLHSNIEKYCKTIIYVKSSFLLYELVIIDHPKSSCFTEEMSQISLLSLRNHESQFHEKIGQFLRES